MRNNWWRWSKLKFI